LTWLIHTLDDKCQEPCLFICVFICATCFLIWMRHVTRMKTHMNESCHTYVNSFIRQTNVNCMSNVTPNRSWLIWEWVMPHMNESCHIY